MQLEPNIEPTEPAIRAAGYARVSTAAQADKGWSLDEQEAKIRAYCDAHGWTLDNVYVDGGVSGTKESRPELDRLLAALPDLDRVVILKLDRIGRNARHLLGLFEEFQRHGVELVSILDGFDTSTTTGRMMPKLLAILAEWEREQIAERISGAASARARAGGSHGGPRTYGYAFDKGRLQPVPDEAVIVSRVFREFAAGKSQLGIARDLTREDVKPPRGKGGWHQSTIGRILRNETYIGRTRLKGETFAGQHRPLVTEAEWSAVASLLEATSSSPGGSRGRPSRLFALRGLLRCGRCDGKMIVRTGGRTFDAYQCHEHTRDPLRCDQPPVPREAIDRAAYSYFRRAGLDVAAMVEEVTVRIDLELAEVRALAQGAAGDEMTAASRLGRVRRDYQDGKLDPADWADQRAELEAEQAAATAEAARYREHEREILTSHASLVAEESVTERLASIRAAIVGEIRDAEGVEAFRAAVMRLFDSFTLLSTYTIADGSLEADGGWFLLPTVRQDALADATTASESPALLTAPGSRTFEPNVALRRVAIPVENYPNVNAYASVPGSSSSKRSCSPLSSGVWASV